MVVWNENSDYLTAVEEYLAPIRDTSHYDGMYYVLTDTTRFAPILELMVYYSQIYGKTILDSGCGGGGLIVRLQHYEPAHTVGIEIDPELSRLAKLRLKGIENIEIITNDAAIADLPSSTFDHILSVHVVEHVMNATDYLTETFRLLKPGGHLYIACPNQLFPYEAHSGIPIINYFPRPIAKAIAGAASRLPLLPGSLRQLFHTSTLYEHNIHHFRLKRMLHGAGFIILEQDHPRWLLGELNDRGQFRAKSWLLNRSEQQQWYFSSLFSKQLIAVCQKPSLSTALES